MLVIRGAGSEIAKQIICFVGADKCRILDRDDQIPIGPYRYLFCQGLLYSKPIGQQTADEVAKSLWVNGARVIRECDFVLQRVPPARICIIGSESGYHWSYDGSYAMAKAALHRYIETKKCVGPQQLVGISPTIISDAGMTLRREDRDRLMERARRHPKGRFVTSREVAALAFFLLYVDQGYISNTIIRMHGGEGVAKEW